MEKYLEIAGNFLMTYGPNILTALLILLIGLFVINLLVKVSKKNNDKK